jgi:hypothetical protein
VPIEIAYTPSVEPGAYEAVCTDVEVREKDGNNYRRWTFTLVDGSDKSVTATSSMSVSPKSKGGKWIAALLGRQPAVGESVEIVGLPCTIGVTLNDDGFSTIESVLPRKAAPARKATYAGDEADKAQATHAAQEGDDLPF